MARGSKSKLHLLLSKWRWSALLPRIGFCCLAIGLSCALFAGLWVGVAQAEPRRLPKSDDGLFAKYIVPHKRPMAAAELAAAIDIRAQDLIRAEVLSDNLDTSFAIFGRIPGTWFPTRGDSFLWMSTGDAFDTNFLTSSTELNSDLDAIDRAELRLALHVPDGMTCANFDFVFYTLESPPTWFDSHNDFFVAQLNTHALLTPTLDSTLPISAPTNFALGRDGEMVTVQSVYAAPAVPDPVPTNGAVSPLLQARVPVSSDQEVEIYLTLRDVDESFGTSAVAVDNFHWSEDAACVTGQSGDRDGDGLPDGWELYGISVTVPSGSSSYVDYVNLPLIGADPDHRDVMVQIDHMVLTRPIDSKILFNYTPNPTAIETVIDAFDHAPVTNVNGAPGIHLHVDYGTDVPLQWPNDVAATTPVDGGVWTWDSWDSQWSVSMGDGLSIPFAQNVLFCPDESTQEWSDVDQIKSVNLKLAHALVFHYGIWGHQLCEYEMQTSGISRNYPSAPDEPDYFAWGASDFIVTLGDASFQLGMTPVRRMHQEAGTFMHELGHNLGLKHGGGDYVNYKPNHLSVMNGLFQLDGLIVDGKPGYIDYTGFVAPPLTPTQLIETRGVYELNQHSSTHFGTARYCQPPGVTRVVTEAWHEIDWNCDQEINTAQAISAPIVKPCEGEDCGTDVLTSINEWENLVYTGGLLRRDVNILAPDAVFSWRFFILSAAESDIETPEPPALQDQLEERIPAKTDFDETQR